MKNRFTQTLSLFLTLIMVLSIFPTTCFAATKVLGDVDNDSNVSAADARLVLRCSVGLEVFTPEQTKNADVDGSPGITAADARLILRTSVGLETLHTHVYQNKVTKTPTCLTTGIKTFFCDCGMTYTEEISKTSHTFVIDPAVAPTTTTTGLTEGLHCSVCGEIIIKQTIVPKLESPAEKSTIEIKKNDILKTYSSLYDYNEYSIDYVNIDKKDTTDSTFQITVSIGAVLLLMPEDVYEAPNYIKGYWKLMKDNETVKWGIFTISNVEELEYRETSFTCKDLEAGEYTLSFTSYI